MNESTARNIRVQDRYDELMRIGRHGHYETMFQVVREETESLRQQLAALKSELKTIGNAIDDPRTDLTMTMSEIIIEQKKQLAAARADNIRLREAINAAEIDGEEVLDFDECTAYMIPLDTYHALTDALAATADLGRYVICESEPVAWLWQRNHSNGGYTREVCQFESKARDLAEDGKTLPTPDSVTPLYRKAEL